MKLENTKSCKSKINDRDLSGVNIDTTAEMYRIVPDKNVVIIGNISKTTLHGIYHFQAFANDALYPDPFKNYNKFGPFEQIVNHVYNILKIQK